MANVFTNATGVANAAGTAVYTVGATDTAVILGLNIANTVTSSITIDVQLGTTYLVKGAPIPVGSALSVLDGKIIAKGGESITVTTQGASEYADVIVSVMEQR